MSVVKQSSVIWFAMESWKLRIKLENKEISIEEHSVSWVDLLVKAREIHKEEIMDANFYGQRLHTKSVSNTMMEDNAEGYYNETFNTNEK